MTYHFKTVCKCGTVITQCRCPAENKRVDVTEKCEHNWQQELVDELDEQYDIAANVSRNTVEVEMNGVSHIVDVALTNVYGFVVSLTISDETGAPVYEVTLASCVKRENLASDIAGIYNSYQ